MPSAANLKSEKAASAEASDNSPIRQIVTLIEHKIRNLEKRKSKLTSYRDLQKAGKELNGDQKVAVAKYDEVAQTLEFARELAKNVSSIVILAEKEAKKQAKKEAWVRSASDTGKIREVLLILDCLTQMGNNEAREDFLNGTNGAAKLSNEDLNILDNLYPEVTPKHEVNEEGQPGFQNHVTKAAEHLYGIIDGKPKDVLGTSYTHIKEIITTVHECGYFDRVEGAVVEEPPCETVEEVEEPPAPPLYLPPAPTAVSAAAYPLCPLPPITLQEVEHAYFAQQYPQQRPISEVIGSQNFFFLQESEIDSPVGTPQPAGVMNQTSPPAAIPSQTFTNQHFVQMSARDSLPPHYVVPEHAYLTAPPPSAPVLDSDPAPSVPLPTVPLPSVPLSSVPLPTVPLPSVPLPAAEVQDGADDGWNETTSPERDEEEERAKGTGHGDGAGRFRRYGRGGSRPATNGYRGRGGYGGRSAGEHYHRHNNEYRDKPNNEYRDRSNNEYRDRSNNEYRDRPNNEYRDRPNNEYRDKPNEYRDRPKEYSRGQYEYQPRHKEYQPRNSDTYYGNGDSERHDGYKGRGRGAARAARGARPARPHYARHQD